MTLTQEQRKKLCDTSLKVEMAFCNCVNCNAILKCDDCPIQPYMRALYEVCEDFRIYLEYSEGTEK